MDIEKIENTVSLLPKSSPDKAGLYIWKNETYPYIVREVLEKNLAQYPCEPKGSWYGPIELIQKNIVDYSF